MKFQGGYSYQEGRFVPTGEMSVIEDKIKAMKLCFDSGPGDYGSVYFDPLTKDYWHYIQNEHYETELNSISREEAARKYPTIDLNRLLDVAR